MSVTSGFNGLKLHTYPERIEITDAAESTYIGQKGVVALEDGVEVVYLDSFSDKIDTDVKWRISPPRHLDLNVADVDFGC